MSPSHEIVILGLSITSSWGNGHATCYRGLVKALSRRGHRVLFLERDVPWYAANRDLPTPPHGATQLYHSLDDLTRRHADAVAGADLVIVGSYVPQGVDVGRWVTETAHGVTAFYDIDTPVTLAKLQRGDYEYLSPDLIPRYDLYLSFTGGPTLQRLERQFGARRARAFHCFFDPELYFPERADAAESAPIDVSPMSGRRNSNPTRERGEISPSWRPSLSRRVTSGETTIDAAETYDLGYMGTYSDDRQPTLERLLLEPARRWPEGKFVVAGPQYPDTIRWPENVRRIEHLPPAEHRRFYTSQRFTLNVTRADMVAAGHSPSVRLFEAAACGTPIISDWWEGLDEMFTPDEEILIAHSPQDTLRCVRELSEERRLAIGEKARRKALESHTCECRADELERHLQECLSTGFGARFA